MVFASVLTANATEEKAFLSQTKKVPSTAEWSREITTKGKQQIRFTITANGPVSILLLADRTFQAIKSGDTSKIVKSDLVLNVPSTKKPHYEKVITIPAAGSYHFMLQNLSKKPLDIKLECFSSK